MLSPNDTVQLVASGQDESRAIPVVPTFGDPARVIPLVNVSAGADISRAQRIQVATGAQVSRSQQVQIIPSFELLLQDSDNGAVNTVLNRGTGSATFTRATAAAARLSTGLWKLDVASGTARSHYWEFSPGVMTYGGYLAEPAATQLATNVRDMTNAAWTKGATITVAQTGTGIDGVSNSCTRVTGGAVAATNTVFQTLTAAASSRTYSCFIKRVTGTGTINITQNGGTNYTDVTAQINSTTFTQVQLNASILNASFGIQVVTSGDVILVDCNQFEAGTIATTPIPAAGTRNADVLSYAFSGNADLAQGTAYAELATEWSTGQAVGGGSIALLFGNSGGGVLAVGSGGASTAIQMNDTTTVVSKSSLTSMATGVRKRASSWGSLGQAITGDGAAVATGAFDGAMGANQSIYVGHNAGSANWWLGTIKNVRIWTQQLTNQYLQSITS